MYDLVISTLCRANSDIAQVRAKAKQEQAAYQATLRKEQMKVDSLESTLEQRAVSVGGRLIFPPSTTFLLLLRLLLLLSSGGEAGAWAGLHLVLLSPAGCES